MGLIANAPGFRGLTGPTLPLAGLFHDRATVGDGRLGVDLTGERVAPVAHVEIAKNRAQDRPQPSPEDRAGADPPSGSQPRHPLAVVGLVVAERHDDLRNPRLERPRQRADAAMVDQRRATGQRLPHGGPTHMERRRGQLGGHLRRILAENEQPPSKPDTRLNHPLEDFPAVTHRGAKRDGDGRRPIGQKPVEGAEVVAPPGVVMEQEAGVNGLRGQRRG